MSFALSIFTSAAVGAINALGAMAFGATGGVVLGGFSFTGMEVPEFITIGGAHRTVVHTLPGGERIVDLMGPEDHDLEWSGILIDGFPELRAQLLDQMRIDGFALPLQWGSWYYTVKVTDFRAETRYSQLHYRIRCMVLVNPAHRPTQAQPETEDAVSSDLGEAQTTAPDAVKPSVAGAQQTLPEPPLPPNQAPLSAVDAARVDENLGMDTATGLTVAAPNDPPPIALSDPTPSTSAGFVDEFGRTPTPPFTSPPPVAATVGTEGGLMPPPSPAEAFTSSPFIN